MVAESESPLLAHKGHGDEGVLAVLERFSDWRRNISLGVAAFEAMHDALFPLIFLFWCQRCMYSSSSDAWVYRVLHF